MLCPSEAHLLYGFGYSLGFSSSLSVSPVYYISLSSMIPFLFPCVRPLPLSIFLQPSRRPSLQPTFSLDCLSAPSPLHHCHQNQRSASQLSLCLGNPHPSSPFTSSHLPAPPLYLSSLQFPHHFSSDPNPQPQSLPFQNSTFYNHTFSQHNNKFNPESKPGLSLRSHPNFCFPPHNSSESWSNGSCPHKTNPPTNGHLLCSSQPKSNISHPWLSSPLLSQSSPNLNSLPRSLSNICPHTIQNIQPESNSNPKTLTLPRSFHPGCQTNPSTSLQTDCDPQHQHPAVQSCGRPPLVSPAPLTLPRTARPSACSLSSAHHHPPSRMPRLPVATNTAFPIPCSERHTKAGGVLLTWAKAVFITTKTNVCVFIKKVATFKSVAPWISKGRNSRFKELITDCWYIGWIKNGLFCTCNLFNITLHYIIRSDLQ